MLCIDGQILLFIQEYMRNAVCDVFFKGITHLGDAGIFWIVLTIVLLCIRLLMSLFHLGIRRPVLLLQFLFTGRYRKSMLCF